MIGTYLAAVKEKRKDRESQTKRQLGGLCLLPGTAQRPALRDQVLPTRTPRKPGPGSSRGQALSAAEQPKLKTWWKTESCPEIHGKSGTEKAENGAIKAKAACDASLERSRAPPPASVAPPPSPGSGSTSALFLAFSWGSRGSLPVAPAPSAPPPAGSGSPLQLPESCYTPPPHTPSPPFPGGRNSSHLLPIQGLLPPENRWNQPDKKQHAAWRRREESRPPGRAGSG